MVREIREDELDQLLELYLYLHEDGIPEKNDHLANTWKQITEDPNHHIIVNEIDGKIVSSCVCVIIPNLDGKIVSSCVCVIIPNLTRGIRPYAFVENVVTHADYRKRGYAGECLAYAKKIATDNDCYKMMLLTGSKRPETLNFYAGAGYNSTDKTAFVQWL